MTTFIIISSLIIIATFIAGAIEGSNDATYGTDANHKPDFIVRVIVGTIVSSVFNFAFISNWFVFVVAFVLFDIALGFAYGFSLDLTYNLKRGFKASYIGNTALSDIEARKIRTSGIWYITIKLIGFAMFAFVYYAWVFHKS